MNHQLTGTKCVNIINDADEEKENLISFNGGVKN